ncbi:cupin domain-containing protein [Amaricoccus sp.]|uniref:cupin domain-containing protein n=1 Tax=Amaricoccus sp. TaxID=1872485 RepID=UPI001B7B768E|nr:cupin domain-containing protein [Amaricoccus sp.]MBP7000169.1 cupin domain-containing protein [Amaricoccus sp.]
MPLPSHVVRVTREGPGESADAAPGRLVAGSGASTVWNAFSDAAGRLHVGHWSSEPGVRRVAYAETELCVLLEGRVRLADPDGEVEFGPGEAFVIAAGFEGTWESLGRVTKIYAVLEP